MHIFVERRFDPSVGADAAATAGSATVQWRESFVDHARNRMLCRYIAADTATLRGVLDANRIRYDEIWSAVSASDAAALASSVAYRAGSSLHPAWLIDVVGERRFESPMTTTQLQAITNLHGWCPQAHGVQIVGLFASADGLRMVCLCRAVDAESVRLAHRCAGMPLDRAWPCHRIEPGTTD